jgi:hypothetical protein
LFSPEIASAQSHSIDFAIFPVKIRVKASSSFNALFDQIFHNLEVRTMKRMMAVGLLLVALAAILPAPALAAPVGWGSSGRWVVALTDGASVDFGSYIKTVPYRTELGAVSVNGAVVAVSRDGTQTVRLGSQWGKLASGVLYTYVPVANVCGEQLCTSSFVARPRGWGESWIYTGKQVAYQTCRTDYVWQRSAKWPYTWGQVPVRRCVTNVAYRVREITSNEFGYTMTPW